MTAYVKPLETFSHYISATKLKTVRYQCSHCGRFVSGHVVGCPGCGADLR